MSVVVLNQLKQLNLLFPFISACRNLIFKSEISPLYSEKQSVTENPQKKARGPFSVKSSFNRVTWVGSARQFRGVTSRRQCSGKSSDRWGRVRRLETKCVCGAGTAPAKIVFLVPRIYNIFHVAYRLKPIRKKRRVIQAIA